MSNQTTIEPTIFENARSGNKTYGVRVYDSYGQSYINTWEEIPKDNIEVLDKVIEDADDFVKDIIRAIKENECGITIGGTFYDYDEIKESL